MKRFFRLLGPLTLALAANAFAQDKFPSKPITLICPWSPGGGGDHRACRPAGEITQTRGRQ
jgi:tripartite-type tricarboxylate transporter receptor subunit TctC